MSSDPDLEIGQQLLIESEGRAEHTRRAYQMLPTLQRPRILDVGCGTGIPTLELAKLSGGQITAVDVDEFSLRKLAGRAKQGGLADRVAVLRCSMSDMDFPDASFDVVWAEGSTWAIGFERALAEWRRFLKPRGFLVVHEPTWLRPDPPEEIRDYWMAFAPHTCTVPAYLDAIRRAHYDPIGHFLLPEDGWWKLHYGPLERRVGELRSRYAGDAAALGLLEARQHEIDMYRRSSRWYGSAFLLMQRR